MRDMVEGEGERDGECASERSYMIERKGKVTSETVRYCLQRRPQQA